MDEANNKVALPCQQPAFGKEALVSVASGLDNNAALDNVDRTNATRLLVEIALSVAARQPPAVSLRKAAMDEDSGWRAFASTVATFDGNLDRAVAFATEVPPPNSR